MRIFTKQNCYMCVFMICFVFIGSYCNYFRYGAKEKKQITKEELIGIDNGHKGTKTNSQMSVRHNKMFSNDYKRNISRFVNTKIADKAEKRDYHVNRININSSKELNSRNCGLKNVTLSRISLPIIGLVSFPGSGNTWVRHLIQQMTGLATSSVYCDKGLRMGGFLYECERNKSLTLVVKTHGINFKKFSKIVFLIRNPFDSLLSYAHYVIAGHTGLISTNYLIKASDMMFNGSLRWYIRLINATMFKFKGPVYILQYENLQKSMSSELKNLATFLKVNVTDEDIFCTVKLQEGNFHRIVSKEKRLKFLRTIYSHEQIIKLQEVEQYSENVIRECLKYNCIS